MPSNKSVELWLKQTPPHFVFHWKAYGMLTGRAVQRATLPWVVKEALPPTLASKPTLTLSDLTQELKGLLWGRFHEVCATSGVR